MRSSGYDLPPLTPAAHDGLPRYTAGKFSPKFCHISHKQAFTLKQSRCPLRYPSDCHFSY